MTAGFRDNSILPAGSTNSGWRKLAAIVAAITVLWLFVLPEIGELEAMQSAIQTREARGIDSGAMFYTDLEMMHDVLARSREFHREHPDALWRP